MDEPATRPPLVPAHELTDGEELHPTLNETERSSSYRPQLMADGDGNPYILNREINSFGGG